MPRAPHTSVVFSPEGARDSPVKWLTARPLISRHQSVSHNAGAKHLFHVVFR